MKNSASKNQRFALEARAMFLDETQYDEYELIGYCRLVKAACKKQKEMPSGPFQISIIKNILKTLDERRYNILRWRYWEGNIRDAVGKRLGISAERVRQLESDVLNRVQCELQSMLEGGSSIEVLNLKTRSYMGLKRAGINTIEQLVKLSPKELLSVKGIWLTCLNDIKGKLANYIRSDDSENKKIDDSNPIDVFRFDVRLENALKKAGVMNIKQLFSLSNEELYKIKGIGRKGIAQITSIRPKEIPEQIGKKIEILRFSTRVENALKREGVLSVEQFILIPVEEFNTIRGIGKKGFDEVVRKRQELFG